jgi:uncharacterized protein (DUF885 family)
MRVLLEELLEAPLMLTQLRMLEAAGLKFHQDELPDLSLAADERLRDRMVHNLETLRRYERVSMDPEGQLSYDVATYFFGTMAQLATEFLEHGYAVDQLGSIHVRFPDVMTNHHAIDEERDARDYITRCQKLPFAFEQLTEKVRHRVGKGFTIPKIILTRITDDAQKFADYPLEENPLVVDFRKKVAELEIDEETRTELATALVDAVRDQVVPAYASFAAATGELAKTAPEHDGVWHQPNGDAFYRAMVRMMTTTDMSPDEIHDLGLTEVERIHGEMRTILTAEGYDATDVGLALRKLREEERFYYADSDEGRAQIVADYLTIITEIQAGLEPLFVSKGAPEVAVERVPKFKEETAPFAYYNPPALDGSKPGTFFINLRDIKEHPRFGMRTLAFHEAVPGHHLQLSIAQKQEQLPMFRRLIPMPAYTEGWALYAEQLAAESGFQEDPFDRIGYLDAQLFRAIRLVVDTGMHAKRWSRQQATQYMIDNSATSETEAVTEIERYMVWPGQALSYMVGRIRMLELRERARARLGDKLELRELHELILTGAALPLDLLDREVDGWIAQQQGAPPG